MRRLWQKLSIPSRGSIVVGIPVSCSIASLIAVGMLQLNINEDEKLLQHAQEVQLQNRRLLTTLLDAEKSVRTYARSGDRQVLNNYHKAKENASKYLNSLKQLLKEEPESNKQAETIGVETFKSLDLLRVKLEQIEQKKLQGLEVESRLMNNNNEIESSRQAIEILASKQDNRLLETQDRFSRWKTINWLVLFICASLGICGAMLAFYLFRQLERELKERETNLQAINLQLMTVNEQLQRFTANASHELRAPLAALLSNAQVALLSPNEDIAQYRKRMEKIVEIVKSMSQLVGNLLFLSRAEGDLDSGVLQKCDLTILIQDIFDEFLPQAQEKNIELQCELPQTSLWYKAQPNLLRQATINLLTNALRYTPADGRVIVRLISQKNSILIQVEDTGIGIEEKHLSHIFESFYRVDRARSKATGGFGLGLAIARSIVKAHRGSIDISSIVNRGSTFQIKLPKN